MQSFFCSAVSRRAVLGDISSPSPPRSRLAAYPLFGVSFFWFTNPIRNCCRHLERIAVLPFLLRGQASHYRAVGVALSSSVIVCLSRSLSLSLSV